APRSLPGFMDPAAHNTNHEDDAGAAVGESVGGFGLGTPTDGPLQAPSYTNFSPLFSASNLTGLPPVAPIALRAGTAANSVVSSVDPSTSYFPSFLDGSAQNGNGFLMDQHGTPNPSFSYATLAAPVPIPCEALAGMKRRRLDDFGSGMMTFASGDQPVDAAVGYARPAPLDAYPSGGFPVTFDMPHLASESMPYFAPTATYPTQQNPSLQIKQTSSEQPQQPQPQRQQQLRSSSPPQEEPLTPESAVDAVLKKTSGSSCHQCKNRRESRHLNFCRNRTRCTGDDKKKKVGRA
ncbi:hypothetical protein BVRB_020180, partial [Beta vulgaris subsp. vulgaris]